ncbi:MAG: hypothetical protein JWQ40_3854 [Segetibacter sp.]|jgi:hypothetical protein|nr:hypothetical protein [Segetibacter sp.]
MKKLPFLLIASFIFSTAKTFSQQSSIPSPSLNLGVEAGLPVGDFGKGYKVGLGGSLKALFPVATDAAITLSAGYMSFSGKETTLGGNTVYKNPALNMIPIKAGFQYSFPGGLYFEPQLGYTNFKVKDGKSNGAFTYAANLGYLINRKLDLSARYEAFSKNEATTSFAGLRLGYNFSL